MFAQYFFWIKWMVKFWVKKVKQIIMWNRCSRIKYAYCNPFFIPLFSPWLISIIIDLCDQFNSKYNFRQLFKNVWRKTNGSRRTIRWLGRHRHQEAPKREAPGIHLVHTKWWALSTWCIPKWWAPHRWRWGGKIVFLIFFIWSRVQW